MSGPATRRVAALDSDFVRRRRIERGLSLADVAATLGLSAPGWQAIEHGAHPGGLTLAQLGALAELLAVPVTDLLTGVAEATPAAAQPLEQRVGALLFSAGRAVPLGALAATLEATTEQVDQAVTALRDRLRPAGLMVGTDRNGVTLVPGAPRDPALRGLLRAAAVRGALAAAPARLLQRLARGEQLSPSPHRPDRAQLTVLLRGGWAEPDDDGWRLHPDVRFSLLLDEDGSLSPATATTRPLPDARRRPLPWLQKNPGQTP